MNQPGQKLVIASSWISSLLLTGSVFGIIGFLLYKGAPALTPQLIFGKTEPTAALLLQKPVFDGLFPAIAGTLALVVTAVSLALPPGIGAGIYLSEYSHGRMKHLLSLFFDVLAGIPSIVVGLFGFSLSVFLHHHLSNRIFPCLLISAVSLSFLVLPYLIRSTQSAMEALPSQVRMIAPALGATQLQNICFVLVPGALSGIVNGIILSIGRCAEDTAVIMLTGAVVSAGIPGSLLNTYEALPFYIYYISSQYIDQQELLKGYAAAVILFILCAVLFSTSFLLKRLLARRFHARV